MQRGLVTLTSSFPGLCVCRRVLSAEKGTLLLTDVVLKAAAASWSGGGSSNIPSLENIVNKDLAEQGELKRNPPVGWGVGAVRKEL